MNAAKNKKSFEELEKMVQRAFGEQIQIKEYQELSEGFCNAAYVITLTDGRETVLKIAIADYNKNSLMSYEKEMMQTEVTAMRIARQNHLVNVADVYYYDDTREICDAEYFFMEKLDGCSYESMKHTYSQEQQDEISYSMGQILARVHGCKGKKFGHLCVAERQYDTWYEAFSNMLAGVIEDARKINVPIGIGYGEVMQQLQKHKKYFAEVAEPSLVHWDTWAGNIFVKNGKIIGLIDWERALWGDGLIEDRFRYHSRKQALLQGYGIQELTEKQHIRCRWYDAYLYIIMMAEVTYRQYPTDEQYTWAKERFLPVWEDIRHAQM